MKKKHNIDETLISFNTELFNKENLDQLLPKLIEMPLLSSLLKTNAKSLYEWIFEVDTELLRKYEMYLNAHFSYFDKEKNDNSFVADQKIDKDVLVTIAALNEKAALNRKKPLSTNEGLERKRTFLVVLEKDVFVTVAALNEKNRKKPLSVNEGLERKRTFLVMFALVNWKKEGLLNASYKEGDWDFNGDIIIKLNTDLIPK